MKLIDKDALVAEIEKLKSEALQKKSQCKRSGLEKIMHQIGAYNKVLSFINTLEVKEVDLKKLGEIARHLIAVKENIEDMRLDSSEWNLLKRIGYPERFKAQKGD